VWIGAAEAITLPTDPQGKSFALSDGPYAKPGVDPTFQWVFGDGSAPSAQLTPTHHYVCTGPLTATFTASGTGVAAQSSPVKFTIPPPFTVDFTDSGGDFAVAPNVDETFKADPSTPAGSTVTWTYGDGGTATGIAPGPHPFMAAGVCKVTMSVVPPGSTCPALTVTHEVTVGPSRLGRHRRCFGADLTMNSSVAGYYITGPLDIPAGVTLKIAPGTNVKIGNSSNNAGSIVVDGTLTAAGTSASPAILTSQGDDSAGGHCSCASASQSPAIGDWAGITIDSGGAVRLTDTEVEYASTGLQLAGGATASLSESTVAHANTGLNASGANTLSINSSTFSSERTGVQITCSTCSTSPQIDDTTFSDITDAGLLEGP
jgi:hypothetical protein